MSNTSTQEEFIKKLTQYKSAIDADIKEYSKYVQKNTSETYGEHSKIATDAYLDVLSRGGKRIRGALVIAGYEMSGGKNKAMILQAARAIEMIHAYILIIDDITDRSSMRRGGKSAHVALSDYYAKQGYGDDQVHFGESVAATAALLGNHAAQMILANLDAPEELRLNAISILNRGMIVTIHGQFNDVFNQVADDVDEQAVINTTKWKTAHYTFLNPLHIGMILAGADCHATDAITDYAMEMGQAFQLTDDILGTFSEEFEVGKSPLDDIKEGKKTMMVVYALKHANKEDRKYLKQALGNQQITESDFQKCKEILIKTGALEYSRKLANQHLNKAKKSLDKESNHWSVEEVKFLREMADFISKRSN